MKCVELTRWLFPVGVVMAFSNLLELSLQVRKKFAWAAMGDCLQKIVFIVGLFFWVAPGSFIRIAGAYWLGAVMMTAFLALGLGWSLETFQRFSFSKPMMSRLLMLSWPLALGKLVSEGGRLFQNRFASQLEPGSVSALTFGQAAIDLPLFLGPLSLSIVLFPYFSDMLDRKQAERSFAYLSRSVRFLLLLFVPLAAHLMLFDRQTASLLFGGGAFTSRSADLTGQAILGLAPGLPFFAIETVLMSYFFAQQQILVPILAGLVATVAAALFLPTLSWRLGLTGVAGYLTLARIMKIALLGYCFRYVSASVPWKRAWAFGFKIGLLVIAASAIHLALQSYLPSHFAIIRKSPALEVAAIALVLAPVYCVGVALMRLPEWDLCKNLLAQGIERARRRRSPLFPPRRQLRIEP